MVNGPWSFVLGQKVIVPFASAVKLSVAKSTVPLIVTEPEAPANFPVPPVIVHVPVMGPLGPDAVNKLKTLITSSPV